MRLSNVLRSALALSLVAFAGTVSAAVVAQLDGPTPYGIIPPVVTLSDVTVGDEGSVEFEFKPDAIDGCLWYMADVFQGSFGEYRIFLENSTIYAMLWNVNGGYSLAWDAPFTDTTSWHSVRMAWKTGEDTLETLDGVTSNVANPNTLADFTSGAGVHALGGYPDPEGNVTFRYDGMMRNLKVYETYDVSASVAAQHDGPTEFFNGGIQTLPEVTVGLEGTVEMEFKADVVDGCLWYLSNDIFGAGQTGEYRLYLEDSKLHIRLWNEAGDYAVASDVPFDDTTQWHSVSLTWKEGEDTLLTLDGVTTNFTNEATLLDFTSGDGVHALGGYPNDTFTFEGMTRNVKVYDEYIVPEQTQLPGDANHDGKVNDADAAILADNWQADGVEVTWGMGDFNGDQKVDDIDATILAANWQTTTTASVPEPSTLVMLTVGMMLACAARLRRSRSA